MRLTRWKSLFAGALAVVAGLSVLTAQADAQVVPGSGFKINEVGDNFEDENWGYTPN